MKLENEIRVLEVNADELKNKLKDLGFEFISDCDQKRYVYDFNPVNKNKWIRLRTNGLESTLTIKEIIDNTKADGTKEWEIKVDDFDETNRILNELGYTARNYQENHRVTYRKPGVEVVIDSWPLIPIYCEIEGDTVEIVEDVLNKLNINSEKVTTLDVSSIYEKYGIDIKQIKELKF